MSSRLRALCQSQHSEVTIGALADAASAQGTALLVFLFALAALVPGVAPAFGAGICWFSIALITGSPCMPLPGLLSRRRVSRQRLTRVLDRWLPRLERIERYLEPRLGWLVADGAMRPIGLACFTCGVLVVLPIPFGNLPPAVTVLILALGMAAGDGLMVLVGYAAFLLALALDIGLIVAAWDAVAWLLVPWAG
jgi:hypothetical protein